MAEAAAPGVNLYQVVLIVSSYVRRHQLGLDQLIGLIVAVHRALAVLGLGPPPLEKPPEPDHPTISAARLCRVSRMRVSRPGTAPSFVGAARARGCCVSYPLEFTIGVNATPPGSHPAGSMLPPAGRDADRSVARSRDRCRRRRANR